LSPTCSQRVTYCLTDFILTYTDEVPTKKGEDADEKQEKRRKKRQTFLENCEAKGLMFEHQDCCVSSQHVYGGDIIAYQRDGILLPLDLVEPRVK
jgi:hypothetical protein